MEENSSAIILDGDIVGVRLCLATPKEILTASVSGFLLTMLVSSHTLTLVCPSNSASVMHLVLPKLGNVKVILDILNYQYQYIIPATSVNYSDC